MKESYSFQPIKGEVERKKEATKIRPLTSEEHEGAEQRPMILKDHWLSLRQSIQEKLPAQELEPEEREKTKLLNELISSELMGEYKKILKKFKEKTRKTEDHPQREFIDVNEEELSNDIEKWIIDLLAEIKNKKEIDLDQNEIEELHAQCWLLFDSIGNVMNTKSIEKDIINFYKDKTIKEGDKKEQDGMRAVLKKELQGHYPLDENEIEILINLVMPENESYSPKILVETITKLWKEYNLGEKKGEITKISLGYLMARGIQSFAPSLFQDIMLQGRFNVPVFLEFLGLSKVSEFIDAGVDIELAKVMNKINHQINERITNSLFFQEFEFIHEKSLGEIYSTLEKGKKSTEQILQDSISKFAPTLAGATMSAIFLTKINPILGAISVAGYPVMWKMAKEQNKKIVKIYEEETNEGEKIATRIGSIKSGFEEIKTSSEMPLIAHHVKEQMNTRDTLSMKRFIERTKMSLVSMIPYDISSAVAAGVGGALQQAGVISGGAVLSNITYANQMNRPIQELVKLYYDDFAYYIQDIQRMSEILGEYEKMDLPEGEKEKDRKPVSELENFDISIKNLRYKNILRGVSINIKQGEFISIAGASGAGKSTLLRNLVGLYKPDSGEVKIGGTRNDSIKKYGKESLYSAMSYCNQNPQIFAEMTLRENLLLWSKKEVNDEKIRKVLDDLHLNNLVNKLDEEVNYLSGGEKVRLGLARTLIKGAKIMLLDEPTASLDSQSATEVRKVISEISKKYPDTTIVCVSHDEELIKTSNRSINMSELQK